MPAKRLSIAKHFKLPIPRKNLMYFYAPPNTTPAYFSNYFLFSFQAKSLNCKGSESSSKRLIKLKRQKIRVKVRLSNLSDMRLTSDEKPFADEINLFEEAWRMGSDLTSDLIDEIITEWRSRDKSSDSPKTF